MQAVAGAANGRAAATWNRMNEAMSANPPSHSLAGLEAELATILGPDLATSLIGAARTDGAWGLDLHLAINDGLERLEPDRRAHALALVERLLRSMAREPGAAPSTAGSSVDADA